MGWAMWKRRTNEAAGLGHLGDSSTQPVTSTTTDTSDAEDKRLQSCWSGSSSAGFDASDRETPDTPLPNLLYIPAASPKKQTATDTLPQPAKVPAASELDLMTASIPADLKREEWRLDEFVAEQELHRGYAIRVYKARCQQSGRCVCIKVYHLSAIGELQRHQALREAHIHMRAYEAALSLVKQGHTLHVVPLYAVFTDRVNDNLVFVMEYAPGKDMFRHVVSKGGRMDEGQCVRAVLWPLLITLGTLHERGVVHRDIKPENLMLIEAPSKQPPDGRPPTPGSSTGPGRLHVALGDFGLAVDMREERAVTRCGTIGFMAPEVMRYPQKKRPTDNKDMPGYGSSVDVWSLGVTTYELVTGLQPFARHDQKDMVAAVYRGAAAITPPKRLSAPAWDFISQTLSVHPGDRPTIRQLARHPWVVQHMGWPTGDASAGTSSKIPAPPRNTAAAPPAPNSPAPTATPRPPQPPSSPAPFKQPKSKQPAMTSLTPLKPGAQFQGKVPPRNPQRPMLRPHHPHNPHHATASVGASSSAAAALARPQAVSAYSQDGLFTPEEVARMQMSQAIAAVIAAGKGQVQDDWTCHGASPKPSPHQQPHLPVPFSLLPFLAGKPVSHPLSHISTASPGASMGTTVGCYNTQPSASPYVNPIFEASSNPAAPAYAAPAPGAADAMPCSGGAFGEPGSCGSGGGGYWDALFKFQEASRMHSAFLPKGGPGSSPTPDSKMMLPRAAGLASGIASVVANSTARNCNRGRERAATASAKRCLLPPSKTPRPLMTAPAQHDERSMVPPPGCDPRASTDASAAAVAGAIQVGFAMMPAASGCQEADMAECV